MRRMTRIGSMLAACWLACACNGDHSCTGAGCVDGVEVRFATPLDATQPFSVLVQPDAGTIQCEYSEAQGVDTCGPARVWVQSSGGSITGFILPEQHPTQLTFTFDSAGTALVSATAQPTYSKQQPNGSDCPPTCQNAVVQL